MAKEPRDRYMPQCFLFPSFKQIVLTFISICDLLRQEDVRRSYISIVLITALTAGTEQ